MTWDFRSHEVQTLNLADVRPGDRAVITIEYGVEGGATYAKELTAYPLVGVVEREPGYISVTVDVSPFPVRALEARGVLRLPDTVVVGQVIDYMRIGQWGDLHLLWSEVLPEGGRVTKLFLEAGEGVEESLELYELEPGTVVSLRGYDIEVCLFKMRTADTFVTVDSHTTWCADGIKADLVCDPRVRLGQPFRWRGGQIDSVVSITVR